MKFRGTATGRKWNKDWKLGMPSVQQWIETKARVEVELNELYVLHEVGRSAIANKSGYSQTLNGAIKCRVLPDTEP